MLTLAVVALSLLVSSTAFAKPTRAPIRVRSDVITRTLAKPQIRGKIRLPKTTKAKGKAKFRPRIRLPRLTK
ncbi:MAG: hypothetical protein U0414_09585 [Polyangiaceae bacterium]